MRSIVSTGLACLLWTVCAQNATSVSPRAILDSKATVIGVYNATTGVDTFLGVPYALPPTGTLRFARPTPVVTNSSMVIDASAYRPVCMQVDIPMSASPFPLSYQSEDCLFVNVIRPPSLNATRQLPVLVWLFGGGFMNGGAPHPGVEPAVMVWRSMQINEPIIYVSLNYRLNSFGFLASSEFAAEARTGSATLNAGLYDIQAALLWVQENIQGFGGDPRKVTVFGESAGAIGISSMLSAERGNAVHKLGLFRGAILESGSASGDPVPPPSQLDSFYSAYAKLAGCSPADAQGPTLSCLRSASTATLLNATRSLVSGASLRLPFNRVNDDYWFPSKPSDLVKARQLADVPVLMGNNLDEGTILAPITVNSWADMIPTLLANLYPGDASTRTTPEHTLLPKLLELYPDDPALGSPYAPQGDNVSSTFRYYPPLATNQYKRLSAILGDLVLQAGRRMLLGAYIAKNKDHPAYNYLFTASTPGAPPAIGVFHGSEVPYVYGDYAYSNTNSLQGRTSLLMMDYWIAFTNSLNPNRPSLPNWPKYGTERRTIQFTGFEGSHGSLTKLITDDYRWEGIAFLSSSTWCWAVYC